jgi:predicted nucleic acid-binding protein
MRYLLDTNIILHIVRNSSVWQKIRTSYGLYEAENKIYISIVTYAEIKSIAKQLNWGQTKLKSLQELLGTIPTLMLNKRISGKYVKIDVYSQGKDLENPLPYGISARNMGKNDLWIAATTEHIEAELITTDKDFNHLDNVFFKVHQIEQ